MQIHELDNFSGNMDSSAYVAVDNGNDTGKVSVAGLLAAPEAQIQQLDSDLNARIDNIIAGGTAPSAAEVTDARLGVSGLTYGSLGAAIRGQVSDIENDIDINVFSEITNTPESGFYYNDAGLKKVNASWFTFKARVESVFYTDHVTGTGSLAYYSTTYPSYLILDDDGNVLYANFTNISTISNILASSLPDGAAWIIFNSTNTFTINTKGIYPQIKDNFVSENNPNISGSVSDYLSAMAEDLFWYKEPINLISGGYTKDTYIDASGQLQPSSGSPTNSTYDEFEVIGGKRIALTRQSSPNTRIIESSAKFAFYDENHTFISVGSIGQNPIAVPDNAKYARAQCVTPYIIDPESYKVMAEYTDANNTIASEYSPYFPPYYEKASTPGAAYSDKAICVFGDSLAANGSGGTDTWIQRVGDALGFDKVYNRGVGGSRVTATETAYAYVDADGDAYNRVEYSTHQSIAGYTEINACCSSVDRANTIPTDTDVLLILAGANDVGNTTLADFTTAYKTMLDNIYSRIPDARVMLCTMPFHYAFDTGASAETYQQYRDLIKTIGAEYGFPIIDFKADMMVNKNNYQDFMASDYVHYTTFNGRTRFAEVAIPKVEDIRFIYE